MMAKGVHIKYSQEEKDWLKAHHMECDRHTLRDRFNKEFGRNLKVYNIQGYCKRNKLASPIDGQFKKGSIPFNKGKKWHEYTDKEIPKSQKRTQFKKGQREVWNYKPVGTVSDISHDNKWGGRMLWIKVSDEICTTSRNQNWKPLHKYIWEQANGEVPDGYELTLKDRNYKNCSLDNIILVEKSEMVKIAKNNGWTTDGDINEAVILTTRLENLCERKKKK